MLNQFYDGFSNFIHDAATSRDEDPILVPNTKGQAKSDDWNIMRCLMFTASTCKEVIHMQSEEAMKNYLMSHLWKITEVPETRAMKWGTKNEPIARGEYVKWKSEKTLTAVAVEETGLLASRTFPFLGCSTDGIVHEPNKPDYLLEIKCPFTLKDHDPQEFDQLLTSQQLQRFPFYRNERGVLLMKNNHSWFYEIQMQMDICKLTSSEIFIWSPKGHIELMVQYDEEFWAPRRQTLIEKHGGLLVPEYILQRVPRNLNPIYFNYSVECLSPDNP
ncbi:Exonuclease [Frankliniella fusca]|uniref:Exonuclease n=1 Tax=Frankliniella fusca TaxID=407009 RepID=A0AAE1L6R5_9NEOP|nr:Exonuclease [Frankliniella fusca]